jgi:transposase InsO family protein
MDAARSCEMVLARSNVRPLASGSARERIEHVASRMCRAAFAVAESFFSSLKKERIRKRVYKTRDLARADVFDYIEMFYNSTRRHSHLGGVSPEAFERASHLGWAVS